MDQETRSVQNSKDAVAAETPGDPADEKQLAGATGSGSMVIAREFGNRRHSRERPRPPRWI